MPDMIKLATSIAHKISELEEARTELSRLAADVGPCLGEYRKNLALTIIKLKNGVKFSMENETIENPPATTTLSIAHGLCADKKVKATSAETMWRSQMKICDMLQAELNGLQSINRNLSDL